MALTKLQPFNLNTAGNYLFGSLQANGNLTANGNVFGTYIIGNGALLTGINTSTANLTNGNSNVLVAANGNITMSVSGTSNVLILSSNSVNVSGTLAVTGNISAGNVTASSLQGTIETSSQPNITSLGTLTGLTVSGNIAALNANLGNVVTANYLVSESGCVVVGTGAIAVQSNIGGIFNSSVTSINFGLGSDTITIGSSSSNVAVNNNLSANGNVTASNVVANNSVTTDKLVVSDLYSKRVAVEVTTNTVIDSFAISEYRAAKYIIKVKGDLGYQAVESLLVHDDVNSMITIYASLTTAGVDLITLTTVVDSGNVQLLATALTSNTNVNLMGTYVPD